MAAQLHDSSGIRFPLFGKLSLKIILAITLCTLIIAVSFISQVERQTQKRQTLQEIEQQQLITEGQAIIIASHVFSDDEEAIFLTLSGIIANPSIVGVSIELLESDSDSAGEGEGDFFVGQTDSSASHSVDVMYFDEDFDNGEGRILSLGTLTTFRNSDIIETLAKQRYKHYFLLITLVVLAIIFSVGVTVHLLVGRPMRSIVGAIGAAQDGNVPTVVWNSNDEMGVVVDQLNYLHSRQRDYVDTLRERLDHSERRQLARLNSLANVSTEAIVFYSDDKVLDCNQRFRELVGCESENPDYDVLLEKLPRAVFETPTDADDGYYLQDCSIKAAGACVEVEIYGSQVAYGSDIANVAVIRDVSDRHEAQRRIRHMATHDGLTDLPNRSAFMARCEAAASSCRKADRRLAFMFLDVDNFKAVNDTYGHAVGDELLMAVAKTLKAAEGQNGVAARLGGDEFALVMVEYDRNAEGYSETPDFNPHCIADSLLEQIAGLGETLNISTTTGASIGLAVQGGESIDMDDLMLQADLALYEVKRNGKHALCEFSDALSAQHLLKKKMVRELPKSMTNGELKLQFQPQMDLASGNLNGFEALLRWNSHSFGYVSPEVVLEVAEMGGFINTLSDWVITESCLAAKSWPAHVPVAFNLSPLELVDGSIVDRINGIVRKLEFPPSRLEVEITETALIKDAKSVEKTLRKLARAGISIALDDFGTGYTSLEMLLQLPIDKIKIDRSYVHGVKEDSPQAIIARAVINLGHGLGMKVLAEGIESTTDLQRVGIAGCDSYQGYLLARPMDCDEVVAWMESHEQKNEYTHIRPRNEDDDDIPPLKLAS